jgi:putative membrane protein
MGKKHSVLQTQLHFRVRPLLLRFIVNALSLLVTVAIVPHVFFSGDYPILSWLLISAVFGLLNAFLKPLLQIIMLPLIFVSYGLVVVLINTVLLWTLAWIFTDRFHVQHILWAFVGGLVCGMLEGLLQNLLGLTPPIVEGGPEALKEEIAPDAGRGPR